jgi:hypothetical protein
MTKLIAVLASVIVLFAFGCGGGTNKSLNNQPPSNQTPTINQPPPSNQTPTITSISPDNTAVGGGGFTLTINGTGFVTASAVDFGSAAPRRRSSAPPS